MNTSIDSAIKAGRGYWFVDGFTEMLTGVVFVLLGGVLVLRGMAPQDSFLAMLASMASDVALIKVFGLLTAGLTVWWLKDRFTYPRTGFVRTKRVTAAQIFIFFRNVVLCLLLPLMALVAAFFLLPARQEILICLPVWSPAAMSLIWALASILAGRGMGLRRFVFLGFVILLVGITISVWQLATRLPAFPLDALQANPLTALPQALRVSLAEIINRTFIGIAWLTLISGALFVLSGLITFLRYRKENPVPFQEEA